MESHDLIVGIVVHEIVAPTADGRLFGPGLNGFENVSK